MRMYGVNETARRDYSRSERNGYDGLQAAFDSVSSQIICGAVTAMLMKNYGVCQTHFGERFQVIGARVRHFQTATAALMCGWAA